MSRDRQLEKLTRQGIELMRRERELALGGQIAALTELNEEKLAFLQKLEALRDELSGAGPFPVMAARRQELAALFEIIKRRTLENQALLKAAEAGVKSAARRIEDLFVGGALTVAYTETGDKVARKGRSANTSEVV